MTSATLAPPAISVPSARWLRIAWVMLPLLATAYQILAARLAGAVPAGGTGGWLVALALRPDFWLLVAVEAGSFLCWIRILAVTSLAAAFPLTAISYVLVIASDWWLFGDPISALRIVGSVSILAGAALIALPSAGKPA